MSVSQRRQEAGRLLTLPLANIEERPGKPVPATETTDLVTHGTFAAAYVDHLRDGSPPAAWTACRRDRQVSTVQHSRSREVEQDAAGQVGAG
jgi:hypothetical protein